MSEYNELYHYSDKRSLVMNKMTGDVRIMKKLGHFDENVYAYLSAHPEKHIPQIFEYRIENGSLIVIEEVIQGTTFETVINDKEMPYKDKLALFVELLKGLRFLHEAPEPIIHRDLKPSNIMLTESGEVKILDYDAAKIYKPNSTDDTTHLGTAGMAAPEQYGFMQSDPRSDIYAVGRMLSAAFPDDDRIQKIAAKASSFDPKERYDSASELSDVLERKLSPRLKLKPLFPPPGFRTRKWWKIILGLLFYPFTLFLIFGTPAENGTIYDNMIIRIYVFLSVFTAVDICNSWTGIFDILPFIKHKNLFLRYLFRLLFIAVGFVIWFGLAIFISALIDQIARVL